MSEVLRSLGDICEFKYGKSLPASSRDGGEFDVYGSNGIVGTHSETITSGPTIVIGRKGSIGELNYSQKSCWPIDTTYYVDTSCTSADLRWLNHALSSLRLTEMNKSAAIPGLNRNDAYEKKLKVPSLSEQRRIASILDKADALRSKRREAIAKLDQLLRSVFLEMFGDPAENPKQWRRAHLGDLLVDGPQNGLYKPASFYGTGTPILRIDGFKSGDVIDTLPIKRLMLSDSEVKKYQIKSNDIIINRVNSPEHLGKAAIFTLADQVVFESNMMRISIDANQANPNYINFFLMQDFIKQQIQKSRKDAINQSSINQEDVQNFRINLPEIDVQDRFAMIIRNIARRKKQYSDQLMQFSTLQTSLQHKFFTQ